MTQHYGSMAKSLEYLKAVSDGSKDYIVPPERLFVRHWMGEDLKGRVGVAISRGDDGVELEPSEMTDHAFEQLSSRCDIPVKYTKKLRDTGRHQLLVDNFNSWVHDGQSRMVRTFDGRVRAILSDRYKAVDNYDVLLTVSDEILRLQRGVTFQSCDVSDTLMHIRFVDRTSPLTLEDDIYFPGLYVRNSEVGNGAVLAQPFLLRQVCSNGATVPAHYRQVHVGERLESGVYSPETRRAEARAILLKIRDITRDVLNDKAVFQKFLDALRKTKTVKVESPVECIGNLSTDFGLLESEREAILKRLIEDDTIPSGLRGTQFGVVQAITATANAVQNPDRAIELQNIGGVVAVMENLSKYDKAVVA